jgi:hypothetical protein
MSLGEVRAVAGKLQWVARTRKTHHYRGWFARKPNCKIICRTYPVLLTFDNEAILVDYHRDRDEELRRAIERDVERELSSWDYCDDDCDCGCSHYHCFGDRTRSYSGRRQIGADIYRAISSHGQALQVP